MCTWQQAFHMDGQEQNLGIMLALHDNTRSTEFGNYPGKDFARMTAEDRKKYMSSAWETVLDAAHSPKFTTLQAGDLILFNTAHIHSAPSTETARHTLFLCLNIRLPKHSNFISIDNYKEIFGIPESQGDIVPKTQEVAGMTTRSRSKGVKKL